MTEIKKMDKLREEYRSNIKRNDEIKEEIRELVKKALDNPVCSICGEEHKTPQSFIKKHGWL